MRILVVEHETGMAATLARRLRGEGMAVDVAVDGHGGGAKAAATRYDVVVLDRDVPDRSGEALCTDLAGGITRILMISGRDAIADKVAGFALGADDYLPTPFELPELVARVRALGRRATPSAPPVLAAAGVVLDPARRTVSRDGRPVELTRKEFGILEVLLAAGGTVVSADQLLERVWDERTDPFSTTVRVTVMTLRRKLGEPGVIDTVVGSGYRVPADRPVGV